MMLRRESCPTYLCAAVGSLTFITIFLLWWIAKLAHYCNDDTNNKVLHDACEWSLGNILFLGLLSGLGSGGLVACVAINYQLYLKSEREIAKEAFRENASYGTIRSGDENPNDDKIDINTLLKEVNYDLEDFSQAENEPGEESPDSSYSEDSTPLHLITTATK